MTTLTIPNEVYDQYHQTIDRGMDFLDEYLGTREWVNAIDLNEFDLEISTECVCGQLFDEDSGYRTVEDMTERDGYSYALKYVVEHGVPDDVSEKGEIGAAMYLGFNLDEEPIDEMIAKANGYPNTDAMYRDDEVDEIPRAWTMLTETWVERIEKRRAELGTMA